MPEKVCSIRQKSRPLQKKYHKIMAENNIKQQYEQHQMQKAEGEKTVSFRRPESFLQNQVKKEKTER